MTDPHNIVHVTPVNGQGDEKNLLFIGEDGSLDVNVQDQDSPPLDNLFAQEISPFTLAAPTVASTKTVLNYTFTATTGHGISVGDELLLLDTAGNKSLQCQAIAVIGDDINIDRPIDHVYPVATTLGRITTTNMAVDGSVVPQIFTIRAGSVPLDYTRFFLSMLSASSMDDGKFGSLPPLERGLVFRIVNGFQETVFNFKTNLEIKQFCYDLNYASRSAAGTYGAIARLSFNGQDKHGVVLRISGDSVLQWIVQDNLLALLSMQGSGQGSETVGEQ